MALNQRLVDLYDTGCETCKTEKLTLDNASKSKFKNLLNVAEKAFKHLHKKQNYKAKDLFNEKPFEDLVNATANLLETAIDHKMPNELKQALINDVFLFGSLRTHAQLFEASSLLIDKEGNIKPYSQLENELNKLNVNYNNNYLSAEYDMAIGSSLMASKWADFSDNDRYWLQYRTAQDKRVRKSHQDLANITLPKSDPFWNQFFPPNGWRCRCTTVQVLKDKYDASNSAEAKKLGEEATSEIGKNGKNRLEIFRFNAGKQQVAFPPKHPFNQVKGAKEVKAIAIEKKK